jgi:methionyl-tRNA formyltransferase
VTKIFIDGQAILAHAVTRKLVENHGIDPKNILVNTYDKLDSLPFVHWMDSQNIKWFKSNYQNPQTLQCVKDFQPDYIMSAYGVRILPKDVLDCAKVLAFNMHVSYLPDYKGRCIPTWAILNGEKEHGITFHVMSEEIDQGDILYQKKITIASDETAYSLYYKILCEFVKEFDNFFNQLVTGNMLANPMPPGGRYFGRSIPFDGIIDPAWDLDFIERFIRALFFPPHCGAKIKIGNKYFECNTIEEYCRIIKSTVDVTI